MTSLDQQAQRLGLIREMERNGCELAYYTSENGQECSLRVYWRGWQTTIIRLGVFDFERAHQEWTEYRDSVAYRILSHQDAPRSAVSPQEARRRSRRVVSRSGVATPHVAKTVAQTDEEQRGAA